MSRRSSRPPVDEATITRLRVVFTRIARELRSQRTEDGLTPTQYSAIVTIRREEPVSLGRIAEVERIAPPTVTKLVDRLCELGLVRREQDPADRRSINVVVSDRAIQLMDGTKQRKSAWLDFRLNQLSGEELSKLLDALPVLETLVPDEDR